jgi:LysM repeat protein
MKKAVVLTLFVLFLGVGVVTADATYTIQPGDTLASIARQFNTTVEAIVQANHIVNPNLIYAGQALTIPGESAAPPPAAPPPASGGSTYTVQPGDTLFRIALQHGVSVQAIAQANGIGNVGLIFVGQVLAIPGGSPPSTPPTTPPPPPVPNPTPVPPPPTTTGNNLLPNGSFEEGWYNQNGIPELQLPNGWAFAWDEGPNPFEPNPWSNFVRPETRVLSGNFLPPEEHNTFIWDGQHTLKMFKGFGAISFRLTREVVLQPGTYVFEVNVFPDLVAGYSGGQKIWATDPAAGEVQLLGGSGSTGWLNPVPGQKNTHSYTFTIQQAQTVRVGLAVRGRFALVNNGWFLDDWSLRRVGG